MPLRVMIGALLSILLAACSEVPTDQEILGVSAAATDSEVSAELTNELYEIAHSIAFARMVAQKCTIVRLKFSAHGEQKRLIDTKIKAAGVSETAAFAAFGEAVEQRTETDRMAFFERYGIVANDEETWCDAGRRMIANQDRYGVHLASP